MTLAGTSPQGLNESLTPMEMREATTHPRVNLPIPMTGEHHA